MRIATVVHTVELRRQQLMMYLQLDRHVCWRRNRRHREVVVALQWVEVAVRPSGLPLVEVVGVESAAVGRKDQTVRFASPHKER